MNSASPTTSASTNRGGRPKDWTEPRARRLVRLYIYTRLPFDLILKLLEEGLWKPGKDAANKVKNSLLGNDPRWIRPKDDEDERRRIAALRNSRRGAKFHHRRSTSHSASYDDDTLTPTRSSRHSFEKSGTSTPFKNEQIDPTGQVGANIPIFGYDEHGSQIYPPWIPSGLDGSRQDTGLTNSTETSMSSSFREKLSTVSHDQVKGAWRVLKQFTFPKGPELQREISLSPIASPGSQFQPAQRGFRNPGGSTVYAPFSAEYAVPGNFLDANLSTRRSACENTSEFHEMGTCWCRIANDLTSIEALWPIHGDIISTHINYSDDIYQRTDAFGNTAFHRIAATGENPVLFLNLLSQALGDPHSLVHATNTAGQTFLHVLHRSWFDEIPLLEQLLNVLNNYPDFNIMATDVYGRSFAHLLQNNNMDTAYHLAHLFDCDLLERRDAFGVKPVKPRPADAAPSTLLIQRHNSPMDTISPRRAEIPPTIIDIPSNYGDEFLFRQRELLTIVLDAVKVDSVNSTNPNPRSEDSRGRNALHCLAEVVLNVKNVQEHTYDNQRQRKRKYSEEDGESRSEGSDTKKRLEYLEGILSAHADVNLYDCQGQTPLMAFVKYRPEDSREDKDAMEMIIKRLHNAGANLEARNREGETALHVAARFGKKVALKELLQLGANPYVRDACGLSVLAAIDDRWANAEDGLHIARLEACRGVFTSLARPAAQEPTVLQEWGVKQPTPASSR
ncbi:ankyrin [Annulohypoxylon maeteangense]|uniref:ankyrin n=1 Tax=Annulohypoxylon maeteangense TaxID=1927788 RepID=UPI002008C09A|nr:ankyrin [Annulohypoxylon maeteangense]KAI0882616.1 ankyrin [Annulohypoxylon maeteangense]